MDVKDREAGGFMRYRDWVHIMGLPLLGMALTDIPPDRDYAIGMLFAAMLFIGSGYSLNHHFDSGGKAPLLPPLAAGAASVATCHIMGGPTGVFLLGAATSFAYSAPPLRLKGRPIVGELLNSVGFSLIFLMGYTRTFPPATDALIIAAFMGLWVLPTQLIHEISHREGDKRAGLVNFYQSFGLSKTLNAIRACLFTIAASSVFVGGILPSGGALAAATIILCAGCLMLMSGRGFHSAIEKSPASIRIWARSMCVAYGSFLLAMAILGRAGF